MILELAVSGQADVIITGDKDLLDLEHFEGISILSPKGFLETF
jgi:predicted nucleic acid-binding protein